MNNNSIGEMLLCCSASCVHGSLRYSVVGSDYPASSFSMGSYQRAVFNVVSTNPLSGHPLATGRYTGEKTTRILTCPLLYFRAMPSVHLIRFYPIIVGSAGRGSDDGMRGACPRFHQASGPQSPSVANRAWRGTAISALICEPWTSGRPVRVMGVAGWWNGGDVIFGAVGLGKTVFTPMGDLSQIPGYCVHLSSPPRGHVKRTCRLAGKHRAISTLEWCVGSLGVSRLALASGSRRRLREGGGGFGVCVCRGVCRHAEPCRCFIYLATESVEGTRRRGREVGNG